MPENNISVRQKKKYNYSKIWKSCQIERLTALLLRSSEYYILILSFSRKIPEYISISNDMNAKQLIGAKKYTE